MSQAVHYLTNAAGERVGVVLDLDTYEQLIAQAQDAELLLNLNREELTALANSTLALEKQSVLDELLTRNANEQLSEAEQTRLDELLTQVDHLNLLKARARYTLQNLESSTTVAS